MTRIFNGVPHAVGVEFGNATAAAFQPHRRVRVEVSYRQHHNRLALVGRVVDTAFERTTVHTPAHGREIGFGDRRDEFGLHLAREQHQGRVGTTLVSDPLAAAAKDCHGTSIDGSGSERKHITTLGRVTYAVRIVHVALDRHAERLDELAAGLPEPERVPQPQVRRSRAATRDVLARTLDVAPASLRFTRDCLRCGDPRHGKPTLVGEPLAFNVSHSGELAVIAVGVSGHTLGVDVEAIRPRRFGLEKLAARTLNTEEIDRWRAEPDDDRLVSFLQLWTAKEAYLKAIGIGIATDLREVVVPHHWWSEQVAVPNDYVASLAVDAPDVALSFEEWRN